MIRESALGRARRAKRAKSRSAWREAVLERDGWHCRLFGVAARDAIATARRLLQHERFHYSLHIAEGVSEIDAVLGVGAGDE